MPDVELLAAVAHGHGAALVVDETWGAHLPFHPDLPAHAIEAGAALVLARLGTATLLHQGRHAERWLPAAAIDRAVRLCAPGNAAPRPLPATAALGGHAARGRGRPRAADRAARRARARPRAGGHAGRDRVRPAAADRRPARARVATRARSPRRCASGPRSSPRSRPSATSCSRSAPATATSGWPSASPRRCSKTLWTVAPADGPAGLLPAAPPGPALCTPRAAWLGPQERVPPEAAVGRIATETLTPFPPGVPAVLPGECLVPDVVATLRAVAAAGGMVRRGTRRDGDVRRGRRLARPRPLGQLSPCSP